MAVLLCAGLLLLGLRRGDSAPEATIEPLAPVEAVAVEAAADSVAAAPAKAKSRRVSRKKAAKKAAPDSRRHLSEPF